LFITIDGIDGAGKTTLANGLASWLFATFSLNVLLTKEPTNRSPWSKKLRASALSQRLPRNQELEFFHKDRLWHIKHVIYPALKQNQVVICDRYVDSTLAYQAKDATEAKRLYHEMSSEILIPTVTFILNCPVSVCMDRISARGQVVTSFEKSDTLARAAKIFESRIGSHYRQLDAAQSPSLVLEAAKKQVTPFVGVTQKVTENNPKPVNPTSSSFRLMAAVA
jgi:dTMP kinase